MTDVHVVRSSERASKRKCLVAWDLGYRQGWSPVVVATPLEFGTGMHAGLEAVYDVDLWYSTTPAEKFERGKRAFVAVCEQQRDAYLEATSQASRTNWDGQDDYRDRIQLGIRILEHYVLNVHPVADKDLKPVKIEVKFQVELLDEDGNPVRCWNSPTCGQVHELCAPVVIEGQVDAIMQDTKHGGYWILDWKTTNSWYTQQDIVWMHDQLNTYSWALLVKLGIDVRGFILAEILKDHPHEPAELKHRRNGGKFSQDKQLRTTRELYEATVKTGDPEGYENGSYTDHLTWLSGKDAPIFHRRFREPKTHKELNIIGRNLAIEVQEMLRPELKVFPESSQFNCPKCAFRSPCEMMMRGMDAEHTLRSTFQRVER